MFRVVALLICLGCLGLTGYVQAAVFSEIFIEGGPYDQPDAVEIAGLTPGSEMQLVVVKDDPFWGERIVNLVNFQSPASGLVLLTENPWPDDLYAHRVGQRDEMVLATLDTVGIDNGWTFTAQHRLVLLNDPVFDHTGGSLDQNNMAKNGYLVDAIALGELNSTHAALATASASLTAGQSFSRPLDEYLAWGANWLTGSAASTGLLDGASGYYLTPGDENDIWINATPEPTTTWLLAMSWLGLLSWRRRLSHTG